MTSTAIVLSPRTALMRALGLSLMPIAAKTDNSYASFQTKMDRAWDRVVREAGNENMPLIARVKFVPGHRSKEDRSIVINASVDIPDPEGSSRLVNVRVRPHILVDGNGGFLPYVKEIPLGDGTNRKKLVSDEHWCIVLSPAKRGSKNGAQDAVDGSINRQNEYYRVIPLALGTSGKDGALTRWNKAAMTARGSCPESQREETEAQWPIIEPFDHCLYLDHRRHELVLDFKPSGYAPSREDDPNSDRMYGTLFGQKIIDKSKGTTDDERDAKIAPSEKDEQGNDCFRKHTFKIVYFSESAIGVEWLKPADESRPKNKALQFDKYQIDGFAALGIKLEEAYLQGVQELARKLSLDPLGDANPLYLYALGRNEIHLNQRELEVRSALRQIGKAAAQQVARELIDAKDELLGKFSTAVLPSIEDVLHGGQDLATIWYRESGDDDVVARWIEDRIEGDFSWASWLHTRVRTEVLRMIAKKSDIEPPARPKKEEPKEDEPRLDQATVAPPAMGAQAFGEAPATEATPPAGGGKKPRKSGGKKKADSAADPAA